MGTIEGGRLAETRKGQTVGRRPGRTKKCEGHEVVKGVGRAGKKKTVKAKGQNKKVGRSKERKGKCFKWGGA